MDYSSDTPTGQQKVTVDPTILGQVQMLCDFMQMLRAWYEHFESSLRQLDRAAAVKAHDLMVEGVIMARQIARQLGFVLPPVDGIDWALSPRPAGEAVDL